MTISTQRSNLLPSGQLLSLLKDSRLHPRIWEECRRKKTVAATLVAESYHVKIPSVRTLLRVRDEQNSWLPRSNRFERRWIVRGHHELRTISLARA